jgi:hypothetical protein
MVESLKEVLRKIKRLADDPGALPGEREAAIAKLEMMCRKYGVSMDDLVEEQKKIAWYRYGSNSEYQLICQIAFHVLEKSELGFYRDKHEKRVGVELNRVELIDMTEMVNSFLPSFRKERKAMLKRFEHAFINRNGLYGPQDGGSDGCSLSNEEIRKIVALSESIDKTVVPRKKIDFGG